MFLFSGSEESKKKPAISPCPFQTSMVGFIPTNRPIKPGFHGTVE